MIYITGDTHIPIDIKKLSTKNFPDQKNLTKSDFVIICGDFGGVWSGGAEDKYWLKWLDQKSFTTLFVDGNHENHQMLSEKFEVVQYHGGKAHRIMDSVYHLMRGQVFTIDGVKIFTMGGAASHDRQYRREGVSWWPEEMPSEPEYAEAVTNLQANDMTVDYVISHCAPGSIQREIVSYYPASKLTDFLDAVKNEATYKHWYFGHYHIDRDIDEKHTCLYYEIVKIGSGADSL